MKTIKIGWIVGIILTSTLALILDISAPIFILFWCIIGLGVALGFLFFHLLEDVAYEYKREENVKRDLLIIFILIINIGITAFVITFF